jgi:hypothetical protein
MPSYYFYAKTLLVDSRNANARHNNDVKEMFRNEAKAHLKKFDTYSKAIATLARENGKYSPEGHDRESDFWAEPADNK